MARLSAGLRARSGIQAPADNTPTSAEMGAEGTAMGDGTAVNGSLDLKVFAKGANTLVTGMAKATATGTGEGAYAQASTFGEVSGADLVLSRTLVLTGENASGMTQTSVTFLFAVDLEKFQFASGPKVVNLYSERTIDPGVLNVDGHSAVMDATAVADARDSEAPTHAEAYTDVTAQVGYSDGSGYGHAIIG